MTSLLRMTLPATVLATAALGFAAPAGAAASACSGADVRPDAAGAARLSDATLCLLNSERARKRLAPLKASPKLGAAAERHARDMVARQYFAHRNPEGQHSSDRIRATGYLASATAWVVGENLAWGTHDRATPWAIVAAWMASPGHRANILDRRYREIGLGLSPGNPARGDGAGATYATTFGQAARARGAKR